MKKEIPEFKIKHKDFCNIPHKTSTIDFSTPVNGSSFEDFLNSLPSILAATDFKKIVDAIVCAYYNKKPVIIGMGAHVIKCGLAPIINQLIDEGIVTGIAMNGAGIIHDSEIAMFGSTSENIEDGLYNSFGMSKQTMDFFTEVAIESLDLEFPSLGSCVGNQLLKKECRYNDKSILAKCSEKDIPCTVHVAFGTDTIHMNPDFDAREFGRLTHNDFKIFASMISELEGGVYINLGSAVIMPEVFMKSLTMIRNCGYKVDIFTTVNMDMVKQYRPINNVLTRPKGDSYNLIGHHEIMIPLLAASINSSLKK